MRFEGREYGVTVLELPCVLESYQTYDEVNLVKTTDVGQVLVVGDVTSAEVSMRECRDGVTPPMRNARQRLFRKPPEVSHEVVQKVEEQLLSVLHVSPAADVPPACLVRGLSAWRAFSPILRGVRQPTVHVF